MSLSRPTLGSIEVDGAHSRRGQRVRRGGGHAAGSAIGSIEGARFQQLGVHLFELFDLAGCERHRPRVEPSAGRLRLMTCPFLSDALSAQAFNRINTRITSGDHTDYHSTLSRTRSGLERSSMAAAVSPEPAGVPSLHFTSAHHGQRPKSRVRVSYSRIVVAPAQEKCLLDHDTLSQQF